MAMYNYEVGGNEVKVDANEAINEIQANKTLLVSQLTHDEPIQPEIVPGLKTVEDVFRHFKPNIEIEMATAEGKQCGNICVSASWTTLRPKVLPARAHSSIP